MNPGEPKPEISVVLVSDYGAGSAIAWDHLRQVLAALARQRFNGAVEYLFVENGRFLEQAPRGLLDLLPGLRVIPSPQTGSYELKNHGAREARGGILTILDTDCTPHPGWLAAIAASFAAHPDAAAISGRTKYEDRGPQYRLASLLSRAYVDRGTAGVTEHVSNNNSAWRRSVFLEHPLPAGLGPFAGRIQSEAVRRSGGLLLFDPAIAVTHRFEGWPMEADVRRNAGYGTVIVRLHEPRMPYVGLARLGRLSIPLFAAGKAIHNWRDTLRCWRHFGLRFHQVPKALILGLVAAAMEIPGMWLAFGRRAIPRTEYR